MTTNGKFMFPIDAFHCSKHGYVQKPAHSTYDDAGIPCYLCPCGEVLDGPVEIVEASGLTGVMQRAMDMGRRLEREGRIAS